MHWIPGIVSCLVSAVAVRALVGSSNTSTTIEIHNDRLLLSITKSNGAVNKLDFDGIALLGTPAGNLGKWYFDCQCIPATSGTSIYYEIGSSKLATYKVVGGADSTGSSWIGLIMSESVNRTGHVFERYFFIKDGENGVHTFARLNVDKIVPGIDYYVGEFRTVFRPNTPMWSHLVTNEQQWGRLPSASAISKQITVQDATWNVGANAPDDAYVAESSDYFTKYQWADLYGDHKAHGFYAEQQQLGLWTVFNSLEGYLGGPLRSDLVVDTNIYNYYVSNHRGSSTPGPDIQAGYSRLFGPTFNLVTSGSSLLDGLKQAEELASPSFDSAFYDSIAPLVPGFAPSSQRGAFSATIKMPSAAKNAKLVLSQPQVDPQDNLDPAALQYWANVSSTGTVSIPRIKEGKYRLTLYAEGIFGDYVYDGITITAGKTTSRSWSWSPEQNGPEVFRIGVPDKTAGEFRHGFAPDPSHSQHHDQYRQYWGAYDYVNDFPNGVNFTVGISKESEDWNYVHWGRFGGSYTRPDFVSGKSVSEWRVNFQLTSKQAERLENKVATLVIQLAGYKSASGNTDKVVPGSTFSDIDYKIHFNSNTTLSWLLPHYHSSSCAWRSGIACYNVAQKFQFPGAALREGWNEMVLALPLDSPVDVMYDAIKLNLGEKS